MEDCSTQHGIVTEIQTDRVFVLVEQKSACASCHARGACSSFDKKNKTIEVATKQASDYQKGDKVEVSISTRLGMKAVVIAFLVPFVLLVISLILCLKTFDFSEPLSCLVAIAITAIYYFILFKQKDKLSSGFKFGIRHL